MGVTLQWCHLAGVCVERVSGGGRVCDGTERCVDSRCGFKISFLYILFVIASRGFVFAHVWIFGTDLRGWRVLVLVVVDWSSSWEDVALCAVIDENLCSQVLREVSLLL